MHAIVIIYSDPVCGHPAGYPPILNAYPVEGGGTGGMTPFYFLDEPMMSSLRANSASKVQLVSSTSGGVAQSIHITESGPHGAGGTPGNVDTLAAGLWQAGV